MDQIVTQVIYVHHACVVIIGALLVAYHVAILLVGSAVPSGLLEV